jgi:arylsulfatase A-like enzyme
VPFIVRWPAQVTAGATSAETICHTDLLATLADMLDVPLPPGAAQDSVSLLPALLGEKRERPLRDYTVHHSIDGTFALRQVPWKYIDGPGSGGWSSQGPNAPGPDAPPVQLYNLETDIGETRNLWEAEPEKVAELRELLATCKVGDTGK